MSEVKTLVTLVLGGVFDNKELGDIDIVYEAPACEELQRELVVDSDDVHVELVSRIAYDAAQSELAALREELATAKRNEHNSEVALKAAYQRQDELRAVISNTDQTLFNKSLRLTAAEQRNAKYESMLRHFASCADVRQVGSLAMEFVAGLTKPTESGESE